MPSSLSPRHLPFRLAEINLRHLALVGMPGAGKTTVGALVARRLDMPFIDLDQALSQAAGRSIGQLFAERGEVLFRAQERAVLREILGHEEPTVIACGGGTWADGAMRRDLMAHTLPLLLSAPVEVLLERLSDPQERALRPLLGGPDPAAALRRLDRERQAAYALCRDCITTDVLDPQEVTEAILSMLEQPAPPLPEPSSIQPPAPTACTTQPDKGQQPSQPLASNGPGSSAAQSRPAELVHEFLPSQAASKPSVDQPNAPPVPELPCFERNAGPAQAQDSAQTQTETQSAALQRHHETEQTADAHNVATERKKHDDLTLPPSIASDERSQKPTDELRPSPKDTMPCALHLEAQWQPQASAWDLAAASDNMADADSRLTIQAHSDTSPLLATLEVCSRGGVYPIVVAEHGGLALVQALLAQSPSPNQRIAFICDTQVAALFVEPLCTLLTASGRITSVHTFVAGEEAKTLKTAYALYDELADAGCTKHDLVVGLGGGVALDMAGFVASTYLRGVPLMLVPTSTLAAVDACVGGKNGVNTRRGKNLVGTIYPPKAVFVAMDHLATQNRRAHTAGLVEVLKIGALLDRDLFAQVAKGTLSRLDTPETRREMATVLARALALKAQVVEEDEQDQGIRAMLNYGHTVGHAIEIADGNSLSHGEAIGLGMLAEASWAETQGLGHGIQSQLRSALTAMNMPVDWRRANLNVEALRRDKKRNGQLVTLPVVTALGEAALHQVPVDALVSYAQTP